MQRLRTALNNATLAGSMDLNKIISGLEVTAYPSPTLAVKVTSGMYRINRVNYTVTLGTNNELISGGKVTAFATPEMGVQIEPGVGRLGGGTFSFGTNDARYGEVLQGGLVLATDTPDMNVNVAAGLVRIGSAVKFFAPAVKAITAAPGTAGQTRYDLVVVGADGTVDYVAGVAAATASAVRPTLPAGHVELCMVTVATGATEIAQSLITFTNRAEAYQGSLAIEAADVTYARYDLIVAGSDGLVHVVKGTAAAAPKRPAVTAGHIELACITVGKGATTITNSAITYDYRANGWDVVLSAGDSTNPRLDLIVIGTDGLPHVVQGAPAASPNAPALPARHIELARVLVPKNALYIRNTDILFDYRDQM